MSIRGFISGAIERLRSGSAGDRLRAGIRRASRYRGALVIVLWQVPAGPVANPDGSIGFMFGGGLDHALSFNCDGDLTDVETARYTLAAVEADYDIAPGLRVEGTGGFVNGGLVSSEGGAETQEGPFGGVRLRYEKARVGVGLGFVTSPERMVGGEIEDIELVSVYARAGGDEGVHFRADVNPVHALMPQQHVRLGLGWNATQRTRPSGFIGAAILSSNGTLGVAGEYTLPIGSLGALRGIGHLGSQEGHYIYGVALGGRLILP